MGHARIVGAVSSEYRPLFTAPIPDALAQRPGASDRRIAADYRTYDEFAADHRFGRYGELFREVASLGDLAVRTAGEGIISVNFLQSTAASMANNADMWHDEAMFGDTFVGLVVSNVLGTRYLDENGIERKTPNYEVLSLDYDSQHRAKPTTDTVPRTRLQIDYFPHGAPIFGGSP